MAFRTIAIRKPATLSIKSKQLQIVGESTCTVPVEDIAVVLIESHDVVINSYCLDFLALNGVILLCCDKTHHPSGMLIGVVPSYNQAAVAEAQFSMTEPLKKRLWQKIIRQKIKNQASCLSKLGVEGSEKLLEYALEVKSGDTTNRESTAARYYFPRMHFGHVRGDKNVVNDALNYSYSIIRAATARAVVSAGFYTPVGIFHSSKLNAFNLVDDLLEPLRPLADYYVMKNLPQDEFLLREDRQRYLGVLYTNLDINQKSYTILNGINLYVNSFLQAVTYKDSSKLKTPALGKMEDCHSIRE